MGNQTQRKRTWGFRLSLTDAAALFTLDALTAGLHRLNNGLWWLVAIAAIHFSLFCNVFRILRRRELIWAAGFVSNVGLWLWLGRLDWFNVLACQLPVSVGVIAWELKSRRYHGIFADRFNPTLKDYLEGRVQ